MKKMLAFITSIFAPGRQRQHEQIEQSRNAAVDRTMIRLREAVEHNKRESDIFERLICDLRSSGSGKC